MPTNLSLSPKPSANLVGGITSSRSRSESRPAEQLIHGFLQVEVASALAESTIGQEHLTTHLPYLRKASLQAIIRAALANGSASCFIARSLFFPSNPTPRNLSRWRPRSPLSTDPFLSSSTICLDMPSDIRCRLCHPSCRWYWYRSSPLSVGVEVSHGSFLCVNFLAFSPR